MKSRIRDHKAKSRTQAIVLDWDDVVFDNAAFKKTVARKLARQGIPAAYVLDTFSIAKDKHGYNPSIHARMIVARAGGKRREIGRVIWDECTALARKLLFRDAVRMIRAARVAGMPLYVLSAGRRTFQHARIYGSGLTALFEKIYIVDVTGIDAAVATKVKVLQTLCRRYDRILFLDDRPKTIKGVKQAASLKNKVTAILVWRGSAPRPKGMRTMRKVTWKNVAALAKTGR